MKIHLVTFTYELNICCVLLLLTRSSQNLTYSNLRVVHLMFSGKTIAFLSGVVPKNSKLRFVFRLLFSVLVWGVLNVKTVP